MSIMLLPKYKTVCTVDTYQYLPNSVLSLEAAGWICFDYLLALIFTCFNSLCLFEVYFIVATAPLVS